MLFSCIFLSSWYEITSILSILSDFPVNIISDDQEKQTRPLHVCDVSVWNQTEKSGTVQRGLLKIPLRVRIKGRHILRKSSCSRVLSRCQMLVILGSFYDPWTWRFKWRKVKVWKVMLHRGALVWMRNAKNPVQCSRTEESDGPRFIVLLPSDPSGLTCGWMQWGK